MKVGRLRMIPIANYGLRFAYSLPTYRFSEWVTSPFLENFRTSFPWQFMRALATMYSAIQPDLCTSGG